MAYSLPLGIYTGKQLAKFASLITSSTKRYCGLPVSTMTMWSTLDRALAGLGGVDLLEVASTRMATRLLDNLDDHGDLGLVARGAVEK